MKLYAAIDELVKNDDGTITVSGIASSGSVDSDGEIITPDAMKAAIPDYMKFGAVREMHGKSAAGTALDAKVGDDGKTQFTALIVDPVAIKKVEAGVYKGFSIGGKVLSRDLSDQNIITGLNLIEVSLVDRPANPEALITMYKSEEVEEKPSNEAVAEEETHEEAEKSASSEIKKGLYDVSRFADLLSSIASLARSSAWESQDEQDASSIPAALRDWFTQGAAIFHTMAAEEVAEAIAGINELIPAPAEVVELSADTDLEKAGARFSKETAAAIEGLHKHAAELCAKFDALGYKQTEEKDDDVESSASAELTKSLELKSENLTKALQMANDDLAKALEANTELKAQIEKAQSEIVELKKQPEPPRAFRLQTAISKGEDSAEIEKGEPEPEKGTEAHAIWLAKQIYSGQLKKA